LEALASKAMPNQFGPSLRQALLANDIAELRYNGMINVAKTTADGALLHPHLEKQFRLGVPCLIIGVQNPILQQGE
jgi:hypothetical protein